MPKIQLHLTNTSQKQLALPKNETFNNILKCLLVKLKLTIFTASSCRLFCGAYRL